MSQAELEKLVGELLDKEAALREEIVAPLSDDELEDFKDTERTMRRLANNMRAMQRLTR